MFVFIFNLYLIYTKCKHIDGACYSKPSISFSVRACVCARVRKVPAHPFVTQLDHAQTRSVSGAPFSGQRWYTFQHQQRRLGAPLPTICC